MRGAKPVTEKQTVRNVQQISPTKLPDAMSAYRGASRRSERLHLGASLPLLRWMNERLFAALSLLRHLIARRIQEKALGKLATQVERELDRLGRKMSSEATSSRGQGPVLPGTRFVREWNGKTIAVTAIEGGFEWNSETYRSLSEIARAVTGAHWSGPRFFGLTSNRA